jgi:hypothetical protein
MIARKKSGDNALTEQVVNGFLRLLMQPDRRPGGVSPCANTATRLHRAILSPIHFSQAFTKQSVEKLDPRMDQPNKVPFHRTGQVLFMQKSVAFQSTFSCIPRFHVQAKCLPAMPASSNIVT